MLWVLLCTEHFTDYYYLVTYAFQSESCLNIWLNVKKLLGRSRRKIWTLNDWKCTQSYHHLVRKRILNQLARLTKSSSCVVRFISTMNLTVCYYHVTHAFESEYTLYSSLIVKDLLARRMRKIFSLSHCKWTWIHNYLVPKQTLNLFPELTKYLISDVTTYLYGTFDCMLLSCHVQVSEWICTLQFSECQGIPLSSQVQNLNTSKHSTI